MRHSQPGLHAIYSQRRRIENEAQYHNAACDDQKSRARQEFDARCSVKSHISAIKRRAQQRRQEMEQDVETRRARLARLFDIEDQELEVALKNTIETPMQKRERLRMKLDTIKRREEQEHREDVEKREYMRWRESCDPLRKQLSEQFEKQIIKERDRQIVDKIAQRMQGDPEEEKWARYDKQAAEEFRQKKLDEQEAQRRQQAQNRRVWESDMRVHQQKHAQERQRDFEQGQEFRRRNADDIVRHREAGVQRAAEQAARRKELNDINQDQIRRRQTAIDEERRLDQQMLRAAEEAKQKEEEDQLVQRLIANRKATQNRQLLEMQLNRKKAADDEAEMYIEAVQDEVNEREDAAVRLREEKRQRLAMDAGRYQEDQMRRRDETRQSVKAERLAERAQAEQEMNMKRQNEQEEKDALARKVRNQYDMLRRQCREKAQREALERQREQDEARATVQAWHDEDRRIQEELANPRYQMGTKFRGFR